MPEHADVLAGLYGLRTTGPGLLDLAAALGLGLFLAWAVSAAMSVFLRRAPSSPPTRRVHAIRKMPREEQVVALTAMLQEITNKAAPGASDWAERASRAFDLDAKMLAGVRAELYQRGTSPDPEVLELAVLRAISRAGT